VRLFPQTAEWLTPGRGLVGVGFIPGDVAPTGLLIFLGVWFLQLCRAYGAGRFRIPRFPHSAFPKLRFHNYVAPTALGGATGCAEGTPTGCPRDTHGEPQGVVWRWSKPRQGWNICSIANPKYICFQLRQERHIQPIAANQSTAWGSFPDRSPLRGF
jgi:hypothetical protein